MNSRQSSLITAFFKSPPHTAEGGEDVVTTTPTTNGGVLVEDDVCSEGEGSEGEGEGGRKLTVNLGGLLSGRVGSQVSSCTADSLPAHTTPCNTSQNGNNLSPMFGSSMRQGTLAWDASSGTLALKPPATFQELTTPTIVSNTDTECGVTDSGRGGDVSGGRGGDVSGGSGGDVSGGSGGDVSGGRGGGVSGGRRRSIRRQCRVPDYSMALDSSCSDGVVEIKRCGSRRRSQRRLNGSGHAVSGKRERRRGRCGDRQLVVRVKLCLLRHLPNESHCNGVSGISPHSEPDPGNEIVLVNSELEPDSEVKVTRVEAANLNESVVIVGASPPPKHQPPHPPSPPITCPPPSSNLSGAWAKIFSQPAKQEVTHSQPAREGPLTRRPSGPGSPGHSPRKQRGSSAHLRRSLSRSPRACRSPRQCSPLRSPRKGIATPASPLRSSLTPRRLVPFTPSATKRQRLEYDFAPFSGLVHVTQESNSPPSTHTSATRQAINLKPAMTAILRPDPSPQLSLRSCLAHPDPKPVIVPPLLTLVTPDQRQVILEELTGAHSQERVQQIFHRYCQIRDNGTSPLQSHPPQHHTHTSTSSHPPQHHTHTSSSHPPQHHAHTSTSPLPRDSQPPTASSQRRPLVCRVHVINRALKVNEDAYKSGLKRKSLRLNRKRSTSPTSGTALSDGGITDMSTVAAGDRGGRKEGEKQCTDLWSDVYRPQSSGEVIGNRVEVQRLFDWLKTWKNKCSGRQNTSDDHPLSGREKRRRKHLNGNESWSSRENSATPEWVRGDDDFMSLRHLRRRRKRVVMSGHSSGSEEEERECEVRENGEGVTSVLLLCGGVGCGKTASVYACAAELGCKVFEVNSSSVRSRGSLLATLKEATLSHQVSTQPRLEGLPAGPSRDPLSETGRTAGCGHTAGVGRRGRKNVRRRDGILSFFKSQQNHDREGENEGREMAAVGPQTNSRPVALETCTVILLEEVDILFDSDRGFWSGVYELIATTRRPLILTCNDSRYDLDCDHIKIVFEPPSLVELGMHMRLLCLSHDYHMTSDVAVQLADYLHADIRRVFLYLQFWTNVTTSTPRPLTPHTSLPHIPGQPCCSDGIHHPPCLTRPWQPLERSLPTTDGYREMDETADCAEQHSYLDIATMETRSHDHHMIHIDDIMRPWWACLEEPSSVFDELPMRVSRWREEEVTGYLCEEVERGVGVVRPSPVVWREFTRRVESVRQCLERCAEVFGCRGSRVGVATDGLPFLRNICSTEHHRQESNTKRRFRHYLKSCATVELSDLQRLPLTARFTPPHNYHSL